MAEHSEEIEQAIKQHLIDTARKQVDGLNRWSGGSLRLEAYRVIDTMNELVLLAEREHSEEIREPDCYRCAEETAASVIDPLTKMMLTGSRMFVCPTCGNKRCPKATDHRLDCTNSNEEGQA